MIYIVIIMFYSNIFMPCILDCILKLYLHVFTCALFSAPSALCALPFIFIRNSTLKGSVSASHNKMRKERVRKSEQKLKLHIRNIISIRLNSVEFKIYILEQICVFSCCCFFMTIGISTTVH